MNSITLVCPCGKLKALNEDGVILARGIPFAVTERFQPPEVIKKWSGLLDATGQETDCFQRSSFEDTSGTFYYREFREGRHFQYAESPMTLNIISPSLEGKHPVLLFIHGGSFETGTVGELPYGTSTEYAKRGIVLVSVGYRLNVFGMHGGVNYCLMDQIAAVDWVRQNISAFGGDPDNITIMGQSAGAMCVMDLLCSGKLVGKICHAVMMSGAGIVPGIASPVTRKKSREFWNKADAAVSGAPAKADPIDLWQAWKKTQSAYKLIKGYRFSQPCIDGQVMSESQKKAVKSGRIQNIPIMLGVTSQDFLPVILYEMALKLGILCSKAGHAPVYGYFFDRIPPGNSFKAFHAADLWYMFGNMDHSWRPFEEIDYTLSSEMMDEVASFCRKGKPENSSWLPISKNQKGFRLYDGVSSGLVYPLFCRRKMLHTMLRDPGPM